MRAEQQKADARALVYNYLKAHPCIDCGEPDIVVLDFDHVRGEKLHNVSDMIRRGAALQRIEAEIAKCDVRCANCHRRKTAARNGRWFRDTGIFGSVVYWE